MQSRGSRLGVAILEVLVAALEVLVAAKTQGFRDRSLPYDWSWRCLREGCDRSRPILSLFVTKMQGYAYSVSSLRPVARTCWF